MPAPEEFTGERFLPECTGEIWAEHWHRYLFASTCVHGLDVLDIASGEGYGSSLLGRHAKSVTGVDIDAATVEKARARYGTDHVRFHTGSVAAIPFPDASFDCVVSFETLEHVAEQEEMLSELKRVLRPAGFVIVSTPNRIEYSDKRGFRNEFHVRELDGPEFHALLGRYFAAQRWHGQRLLFNSGLWSMTDGSNGGISAPLAAEWVTVDDTGPSLPDPMYFIAFAAASDALLPPIRNRATLLADPEDSIYREYESTVARARTLEQHLTDRERIVTERDLQVATIDAQKRAAEATIVERDAQIGALDAQKRQAEWLLTERDRQIVELDAQKQQAEMLLADRERIVVERDRMLDACNARVSRAEALIDTRDRELDAVNARLREAETLISDRERIVVERDAQIAALDAAKRHAEMLVGDRERIVVERDAQLASLDRLKTTAEALIADRERIIVQRDAELVAVNARVVHIESLVVERDNLLVATNDRMSLAERVIAELQQAVDRGVQRTAEIETIAERLERENAQLRNEVARRAGWRWWLSLPVHRIRGKALTPPGGTDIDS